MVIRLRSFFVRPGRDQKAPPADFGDEVLHGFGELVGIGHRAVDVGFAQHFFADLQASVEGGLGHGVGSWLM